MIRRALWALPVIACGSSTGSTSQPEPTATVNMRFERAGFYDAPFPSDDLRKADGTVALDGFPNPNAISLVEMARVLAAGVNGFAEEGAVYFSTTAPIDASRLPSFATSLTPSASVFLVGVQKGSPDYLHRIPVDARFEADGGPFGAPNLLSLLPLQGTPLRPHTTYAAVVTTAVGLSPSNEMKAIASGSRPSAMPQAAFDEYQAALGALASGGVDASKIAGLSVYTTAEPTEQLPLVLKDMLSRPLPVPTGMHRTDVFDTYCVYEGTLAMPDYQAGAAPYDFSNAGSGGIWEFDADGKPILQRTETAGVVVTVPRAPMPAQGWPIVHFIRTGGGGNRPLVDRGPQAANGGPPISPGTGPALWFASAGIAGASVDGPHEDLRNLTNQDEDFLMFNIFNPPALRDNVRESGAEYALFAHVLAGLTLDVSDCPGTTGPAKFDATRMGLMGHSMGATIAPLALYAEPLYRAVVLSGAGGSYIENVMWKQLPLDVLSAVRLVLGYATQRRDLKEDDPVLTLFQWAEEPSDAIAYTRSIIREPPSGMAPRNVLMEQGIVDHYIMPPIANAMSLSLGLDLTGTPLDGTSAELKMDGTPTLESVLQFSGGQQVPLPVTGNLTSDGTHVTAVVTQHPSDGIEDGHEIVFQTDAPKREYRCFLQAWAAGTMPSVPMPGDIDAPCQ